MLMPTKIFLGTITKISGIRISGGSKFADYTATFNIAGKEQSVTRTMVAYRSRVGDTVEITYTEKGFGDFKIKETREENARKRNF